VRGGARQRRRNGRLELGDLVVEDLDLPHQDPDFDRQRQLKPRGRDAGAVRLPPGWPVARAVADLRRLVRRQVISCSSEALATAAAVGKVSSKPKRCGCRGCLKIVSSSGKARSSAACKVLRAVVRCPDQIGPEARQLAQADQTRIRRGQGAHSAERDETGQRSRIDPVGLGLGTL
jgi:hypothetical protein